WTLRPPGWKAAGRPGALRSRSREESRGWAGIPWGELASAGLGRSRLSFFRHVALEPLHRALHHIAAVSGIDEPVSFIGIHDQFRGHAPVAQGVPEFEGLRGRALAVPVA